MAILAIVFFLLPEPTNEELGMTTKNRDITQVKMKDLITVHLLSWSILHAAYMLCFYPFVTGMSRIIMQGGFGDATTSALVLSVFTAMGVVGASMFSRLNKKCGKRSLTVAFMIALFVDCKRTRRCWEMQQTRLGRTACLTARLRGRMPPAEFRLRRNVRPRDPTPTLSA